MKAIILIGHGGIPKNYPSEKVSRLRMLEAQRQKNQTPITKEERILDNEIRYFPRTKENDLFHFGTLEIADHLRAQLDNIKLVVAYNEFCAPSIEDATTALIAEGYNDITFLSTMFTRGGVHSEHEIPEIIEYLKTKYPTAKLKYAWPFDGNLIAEFLFKQLKI